MIERNLALIPARQGSKGLKDKNIVNLAGKPLIYHTIEAAISCPFFDRIIVTTDSYKIATMCGSMCGIMLRPTELGADNVTLAPVIVHALETAEKRYNHPFANVFTLQPTSPLRTDADIGKAFDLYKREEADSLISVTEERHSLWGIDNGKVEELYKPTVNRQWAVPYFIGNGAIFITKRSILLSEKTRVGGRVALYVMDKKSSMDIHYKEDIELAEWYLGKE